MGEEREGEIIGANSITSQRTREVAKTYFDITINSNSSGISYNNITHVPAASFSSASASSE